MRFLNIKFSVFLLIIFSGFTAQSVFAQGAIIDKDAFQDAPTLPKARGSLPSSVSMEKYTPIIYPQKASTCVGFSFSTAVTMLAAMQYDITDKRELARYMGSPYYLYYNVSDDKNCQTGLDMEKAAYFVLNNGIALLSSVEYPMYYPFTENALCVSYPNLEYYPPNLSEDNEKALSLRPDEIYRLANLEETKYALSRNMPVVFGMAVPQTFYDAYGKALWEPAPDETIDDGYGHAMVMVGYDDNKYGGAFRVINSWGEEWGDRGFIWIRYQDMLDFTFIAVALQKNTSRGMVNTSFEMAEDLETSKIPVVNNGHEVIFDNSELINLMHEEKE